MRGIPPPLAKTLFIPELGKVSPPLKKTPILVVVITPVPFLTQYSLYKQVMIILILINVNIYSMLFLALKKV